MLQMLCYPNIFSEPKMLHTLTSKVCACSLLTRST